MPGENPISSISADGCVAVRASRMARAAGIVDPYAKWFDTAKGRQLASFAQSTDPAYFPYNIARYLYSTKRLKDLAPLISQLVVLGSGADGRSIWLEELASNGVAAFEVDTATRLESKRQILESHGVHIPGRVRYVPGDLAADDIPPRLAAAGFNPGNPAIVLIEGVLYFLPASAAVRLLDPSWLELSAASVVIFDYWSLRRTNLLNTRLRESTGREPFHPGPSDLGALGASLRSAGFNQVEVTPLESIASGSLGHDAPHEIRNDWVMVECGL